VRQRLPFAAIALTSRDDPYATPEHSAALVRDWGAAQVEIGVAGHINGESGLGDWPAGRAWLDRLHSP
jgi:predicted alpha/beta hydrolase family esterase